MVTQAGCRPASVSSPMSPNASTSSAEVAFASIAGSPRSIEPAEPQFVANHHIPGVGDRMAYDRDFLALLTHGAGDGSAHTL